MAKRVTFSIVADVPNGQTNLAYSAVHVTSDAFDAIKDQLEKLGMSNVVVQSKIMNPRDSKKDAA